MTIVAAWPRFLSPELATDYVGGPTILAALKRQELVSPRVQRKGLTVYDRVELDAACDAFRSLDEE